MKKSKCEKGHDEIVHYYLICPLCRAMANREILEDEVNSLRDENGSLTSEVDRLEEELEALVERKKHEG